MSSRRKINLIKKNKHYYDYQKAYVTGENHFVYPPWVVVNSVKRPVLKIDPSDRDVIWYNTKDHQFEMYSSLIQKWKILT